MAGISDQALQFGKWNRYRYNGIEFDTSLGLDDYEAKFRDLDPQIGRWWQVDPKSEDMEDVSPYASNLNDPIRLRDPDGDAPCDPCEVALIPLSDAIIETFGGTVNHEPQEMPSLNALWDDLKGVGRGAVVVYNNIKNIVTGNNNQQQGPPLSPPSTAQPSSGSTAAQPGASAGTVHNTQSPQPASPGVRRQNRLPDKGAPNSTQTNKPGTTTKKYGPDGNTVKEYNKGHGPSAPPNERDDHVHDYKPTPHPNNPSARTRLPGRPPKRNEAKKDFNRRN